MTSDEIRYKDTLNFIVKINEEQQKYGYYCLSVESRFAIIIYCKNSNDLKAFVFNSEEMRDKILGTLKMIEKLKK